MDQDLTCHDCGSGIETGFSFCPKCGAKQDQTCAQCGTACAPDFAFCPKCGHGLGAATVTTAPEPEAPKPVSRPGVDREADRRPVTVIFADLSGFTALSERLDPEDVRALQDDLHRAIRDVVRDFDGFLEKFVGDAALAVFGAPIAHEDDPERALGAALALMTQTEALSARWEARVGRPLDLHIGVNTGPVVAGALGAEGDTAYAVTGDTVNTASRLQSAAGDGEILVGPTTYRLTQHLFSFEPVGEIEMKGKLAPLSVYRLAGERKVATSVRGLATFGLTAPLIGRDRELDQIVDAFDLTGAGRAQVVRVVGEAGAGKTRLIEEFLDRLEQDNRLSGVAVRRAACSSIGDHTFGVLAQIVRDGYGIDPGDDLDTAHDKLRAGFRGIGAADDDVGQMVPYLGHVLGLDSEGAGFGALEPEQLKRQIFMAARSMFEHRLRTGPVVILVEDLQWSDAASVEVLRYLVDRLDDQSLLMLLTHRPAFDASQLATSRTSQTAIRLAPLDEADSRTLFSDLFGTSAPNLPDELARFVTERAGGNPFYMEEILRSLIEKNVLYRENGVWACSDMVAILDVPLTIQGLLLSRLDRLPDDVRRLAQEASVLGVGFDRSLLEAVASKPAGVEGGLEALRDAELVQESDLTVTPGGDDHEQRLQFTHAIVQDVVYQNLLMRRRTELHGRAGRALERLCEGRAQRLEDVDALAHHFSRSDDKTKGVDYLIAAGDWARRSYAGGDAVRHFRAALETIEESGAGEDRRGAVLERLADMLGLLGERDEALAHYETVLGASAETGDTLTQARIYRKLAGLHWEAGARNLALTNLQAALGLIGDDGEAAERGHLCHEMGRLAFRSGDNEQAIEWATKALDATLPTVQAAGRDGEDSGENIAHAAVVVAEAYNTIGVAKARLGDDMAAVTEVERSLEVAEANNLHNVSCRGYTNLSVLYGTLDPGRAIEVCQRGLTVAKKIGDMGYQSRLYANLGVSYCTFTGRCEGEGVDAVRRAIDLDRQLGLVDHLPVSLVVLGQIYQCHGQPQMAIELYQEALELAEDLDEPQILFPCYDGLATVHLDIEDMDGAEQYMEKAQGVCERAGLDPESLVVMPFLC